MSIVDRVKKIVAEQLGVKAEEVVDTASFVDDLGADSLDTVELVMALEEEFETEIPDEEAEKITTVQAAIDYVNANQQVILVFALQLEVKESRAFECGFSVSEALKYWFDHVKLMTNQSKGMSLDSQ